MSKRRKHDPEDMDFSQQRQTTPLRCVDHEERIGVIERKVEVIDRRQSKIFISMYGPNGDPKEGYVWKLEKVLEWADCLRGKWGVIEKTAMTGALSAMGIVTGKQFWRPEA